MNTKIITAFSSLIATVGFLQEALAENACIANYSTDGSMLRSAHEERVIDGFPGALRDVVEQIIEDEFKRGAWSSPFSQARYEDLVYTIDYIEDAIGSELTPALRFAIVQQFSGPISRTKALEPLDEIILGNHDLFEGLLDRHVKAFKFWSQFS